MAKAYLATNLERVIEEQGRQKKWIADKVGVAPSMITMYAKRQRMVPPDRAERIAELLGVPLFFAFEMTESKKRGRPSKKEAA